MIYNCVNASTEVTPKLEVDTEVSLDEVDQLANSDTIDHQTVSSQHCHMPGDNTIPSRTVVYETARLLVIP